MMGEVFNFFHLYMILE